MVEKSRYKLTFSALYNSAVISDNENMLSKQKFTEIVGDNIKKARTKKGLSQEELAAKCQFYRTYINLIEVAKRTPSSYTLYRIAKALEVPVDALYPKTV